MRRWQAAGVSNPYAPPPPGAPVRVEQPPPPLAPDAPLEGLAVPALVAGVLAVPASLLLLLGGLVGSAPLVDADGAPALLGVVLGGIAVVVGATARRRARTRRTRGERWAIAGMALGVLALLTSTTVAGLLAQDLTTYQECLDQSVTFAADDVCLDSLQEGVRP